jgi:hypothetical protein
MSRGSGEGEGVAADGAGVIADFAQHRGQRLDDNFFRIGEAVDDQTETAAIGIEDGDVAGSVAFARGLLEQAVKKDKGEQTAAEAIERGVFEPLDAVVGFAGAHVHQLGERGLGNGKILPAAVHDEGGDDGEGQGNAQAQDGALAGVAVDFDLAADFFDVGADHIHAHAASGDAGDGGGGGEAGEKDELQNLALVHLFGALGRNELALDGFLADALDAHAGAVVVDLDNDVAAFVTGAQAHEAFGGLALGDANVGHFDAVVDGVADGVGEGIANGFEQALIEFGLLAFHFEVDTLFEVQGEIAHQAGEAREEMADRLHARFHDGFAQIGGDHIEAAAEQGEIGVGAGGLENLVAGQDQLADQVHHAVEQFDVHAQGGVGGARRGSGRGFRLRLSRGPRRRRRNSGGSGSRLRFRIPWSCFGFFGRPCLSRFSRGRRTLMVFVAAAGDAPAWAARFARLPCTGGSRLDGGEHWFDDGDRGIAALQFFEARDHGAVCLLAFSFRAGGVDGLKNAAEDIHEREQAADDAGMGGELAVAQQAEEVFSGVRERFEAAEPEEARRSLDGVHGAEDFRQQLRVAGACFKVGEAPLHAVQAFPAFEQKFASEVVHEVVIGRGAGNLRLRLPEAAEDVSLRDAWQASIPLCWISYGEPRSTRRRTPMHPIQSFTWERRCFLKMARCLRAAMLRMSPTD